jgi:hypothetical protein
MALYPRAINEYLAALEIPRGPSSNVYLVDPVNGLDANIGDRWTKPLKTLTAAYDKCVSGQNDVVLLLANTSGITLTEKLTWAKHYTHLVGMCAPVRTAQRARIFADAAMADAELIEISATGCIFKNLYIFNGAAVATALGDVKVSGGRCYFENVHFAGPGHATNAIDGAYALGLSGGDGEHLFKNCTFGLTTVGAATGVRCVALLGGYTPRVVFEDCTFALHASAVTAMIVEGGADCIIEYMLFKNCLFFNEGTAALDTAFELPALNVARQFFLLVNCWRNSGIDDWEDQARACVWTGGSPDQGAGTSQGDMVVASVA